MSGLRQALEHIADEEWLKKNSPLASIYFSSLAPISAPAQRWQPSGVKEIDELLAGIWRDWTDRAQTPLQRLLWEGVRRLPPDGDLLGQQQALLLLTYFQDPKPKQTDVVKTLAISKATYYRYLDQAVAALQNVLLEQLGPSLRLESPVPKPMVGRDAVRADCAQALQAGQVVALIGASGLGKSQLGAHLAATWPKRPAFWYTFRPGLTDNVQALLFALAYFLYQHGAASLWTQLIADPRNVSADKAMALIRRSFEDLAPVPPLLCFDEADSLLPDELQDSETHTRVRALLEDLAKSNRHGAPMLLIGQRLVVEADRTVVLERLDGAGLREMLHAARLSLPDSACDALLAYTRGNPLLLRLFVMLHNMGEPIAAQLTMLSGAASLDWFLVRVCSRLTPGQLNMLYALSVYDTPAPAQFWQKSQKALDNLLDLGLADFVGDKPAGRPDKSSLLRITLHPALREALRRQLPAERKAALHLEAAEALAGRGEFTVAARHYALGGRPELAVWLWHTHRDHEMRQGHAGAAIDLFGALWPEQFANDRDRKAHALLLAWLSQLTGNAGEGLRALSRVEWPAHLPSTSLAQELRGALLTQQGRIDAALAEYRASLESHAQFSRARPARLHLEMARRNMFYARDLTQTRTDLLRAQHDLDVLRAEIDSEEGRADAARGHFQNAIAIADQLDDPVSRARAHEALGMLEAHQVNVAAALQHIEQAAHFDQSYGNVVCAVGTAKTNLAYMYVLARRYADAIAPAMEALRFGEQMQQPHLVALNEANLAEAWFYLGDLTQSEDYALRGLRSEEAVVRPYCLYVLGHVRRAQVRYPEAEQLCRDALGAAEENQDPWAQGPAWRALGETYRDWGKPGPARAAFEEVLQLYRRLGVEKEVAFTQQLIASVHQVSPQ